MQTELRPADIAIWGERYDDGSEAPTEPVQGHGDEEFEEHNCYVHLTDRQTVERMRNAAYAAGYHSTDVDRGVMLIGNLLTFATDDLSSAVTLQVTGHTRFGTYEEMYRRLGTGAFGFPGRRPEECARETEAFFAEYDPEGPLALAVRKLPVPVLTERDFRKNKAYLLQNWLYRSTG